MVGSLTYLATATRPDLLYVVSMFSQYLDRTGIQHWHAFIHVLKYLQVMIQVCLSYQKGKLESLAESSNADWGNFQKTPISVTGYLCLFKSLIIVWRSWIKTNDSLLTAESKY